MIFFIWLLTVFYDLWCDKKDIQNRFPLPVILYINKMKTLSTVQISVLDIYVN